MFEEKALMRPRKKLPDPSVAKSAQAGGTSVTKKPQQRGRRKSELDDYIDKCDEAMKKLQEQLKDGSKTKK